MSSGLAAPATGPVRSVWYAPGTGQLLAQTETGRIFETSDFTHWRLNTTAAVPPVSRSATVGAKTFVADDANVYSSDGDGRTLLNLTAFNNRSVIGGGFTALAVSPSDPQEISVANSAGVWRSLDGGLSWAGLNDDLPNLPVRRLTGRRAAVLADGSTIEVNAGVWIASGSSLPMKS